MGDITPYLLYRDCAAAIDWLTRVYGFTETLRFAGDDGVVTHAELTADGALFMIGSPGDDYQPPAVTGHRNAFLHVTVDDVDAHFARAEAAGATILAPPTDKEYGLRGYRSEDLEGHRWDFATETRDVAPQDWGATPAGSV